VHDGDWAVAIELIMSKANADFAAKPVFVERVTR
jgi:hypothetical protein